MRIGHMFDTAAKPSEGIVSAPLVFGFVLQIHAGVCTAGGMVLWGASQIGLWGEAGDVQPRTAKMPDDDADVLCDAEKDGGRNRARMC